MGTPLPGVTARVLDHNLAVTPTTGELCVGGGGVARGYLGNPRLTAARFVPDPHGEPGARLYRTGDLAHLAPSGELVFHGRADQQAKINGYRVELGEITAALTAHPAVRAAHTALTPGPEITAYLVGEVDLAELRAHLASQLPTWMHPAHLIPLTELPLTVNGKLDTGRLPLPTPVEQVHQPPRGDTEVAVAAIWSELLAVRNPSRTDDFFAAGGQSLLATQLIARVRVALGRQVALRAVFEHPTIAALAAHLDTCPPADRPLAPASRPARLPLSAAQRRIWVQTQLSTTDAYVIAGSIRTSGAVSTAELADRLTAVVARHEALRTSFPHDEHGPWQLVHPPAPVPLPVITPAERAAFVARPFDLAAGPLLRAATIRHDHDHGLELVVVVHHIACDGWSLGLLLAELAGAPTRPLAVQYADYTLWEAGRDHGRHLAHWRDRLADLPDPLRLPADRPRPVAWDGRGGNHHQVLDAGLTTRLRALAAERGASLFMLLAAAYGVLLGRLSGSRDVLIGTPVSHRPDPALDGLVGLFLNTVTLRLDLSDDPSAAELVDRAREAVLTAHEHQDVPFERVVRDLGGSTEQGTHPVFQTMLSVRPELPEAVTVNGVAHRAAALDTDTAKFDLSVEIVGVDGPTPALRWEYRTQLFDAATVARFAGHFHTLLTGIASAPATRVSRLPLLTAAQQDAALVRPAPVAAPGVLDRFRAAVANHGDRTAVAQAGRTLSYPEFAARAHALAARLRELGAGQETLVGLHAGRGIDTVVGLWAVLLAGAAYLPLDPTHPPARLRQIVESARPVAVLTEPALGPPPTSDVPVLDLAAPYPAAADAGVEPHPAALAYVLYTSGSTGVPKGVAVTHANLATLLSAMDTLLATPQPQTWLALTSTAFDISVVELIWTLTTGATTVLPDTTPITDQLTTITHLQTTPTYATTLLTHNPHALTTLTTLLLGGETITQHLRDLLHHLPHTHHINGYGPTETTVYATTAPIDPTATTTPIGTPLPGTGAVVVEPSLLPAPTGVVGELHLTGAGVSRGYLGNPRLTAQRFRPDPLGEPGARAYRTGDLAHRDAAGVLHFHGRADQQAKVRGYRIELGDITAALARHDQVRSAHTALGPDGDIVSYVVYAGEPVPDELARHLAEQLPAWMRPAHLVALDALPLTVNGKLDTRRLPVPAPVARPVLAPATAAEHRVAALFAELLAVPVDSVEDDFFRLGGHSLLATQLAARLGLPLRAVFDHSSVAALARQLDDRPSAPRTPVRRARPARLPLSPAQRRLWFLEQLAPGGYAVPVSVRISPRPDTARLAAALDALVRRHEALRTTFPQDAAGPHQHIAEARPIPLPTITPAERDEFLARPFDLAAGPLVRAALVTHTEHTEHAELLLVLHHIICDGWSLDLLLDELIAAVDGVLPTEAPTQYADYTLWQADLLAGGERDRQLAYWRTRLADPPAALRLPTDRPRPAGPSVRGAAHTHVLPAEVAAGLGALAAAHGTTLFTALYAAYAVLLSRLSGQSDVVVGTPVANRVRPELESAVGFLANTLALRTPVEAAIPFTDLLDRCHATVLGAQDHQDLPFEQLVEELRLPRDHTRNPLFQAMLTLRHERGPRTGASGHTYTTSGADTGAAKVDLTLAVRHDPEGGLELRWEHPTELFDTSTVAGFAECFAVLLGAVTAAPDTPVGALPLLSPPARRQALAHGVRAAAPGARTPVLDRFAARVAETPEAVALRDDSGTLTYRELDRRSRDLAAHLRGLGVGQETLVGLHAHRGIPLVVGILAILRAGGAYLPLDPAYPAGRVRQIVADARPPVVLFNSPPPELPGVRLVALDTAVPPAEVEPVRVHPDSLAYVIHTSGSTGTPKGVAVSHANLASSTSARFTVYSGPVRGLVLVSSPAFDTSVASIFWSLCAGAELCLPADGAQLDLDRLCELLARPAASHLVCLPSLYRLLLERFRDAPSALRAVAVAGEPVDAGLVALHHEITPEVALYNEYGPTENTVWSTVALLAPQPPGVSVPIGAPVPGSGAHVLDAELEPCPAGVVGEVHLSGAGLARGYLGNPRLTAARFRPDPHGAPGSRAYRTGDLAHRDADGWLHFRGRVDTQVKIRGYRVEPDEVTATLLRHPAVTAAHTTVHTGPAGPELVAHVVSGVDDAELRAHLAEHLPSWLRPAHLVALPALPLTPNGKVDSSALPAPAPAPVVVSAPATPTEERVSEVLRQLLGTAGIGVDHSFFDLGAHSLLLVRACELLRPLKPDLRVVDLFRYPTVRSLAAYLSGGGPDQQAGAGTDTGAGRARLTRRRARTTRQHPEPVSEPLEAP
ncbi:amino acid adenylation domain-containing protein [Goodfellowiella coeruleoviolacea]|uniref:amino acid adenylation domain-containing protein n=1 Tax=Goodfellowiella coeruleoviolacea TaxID=334858 RepID=UPI0038992BAC